jgi:hypothetical protein
MPVCVVCFRPVPRNRCLLEVVPFHTDCARICDRCGEQTVVDHPAQRVSICWADQCQWFCRLPGDRCPRCCSCKVVLSEDQKWALCRNPRCTWFQRRLRCGCGSPLDSDATVLPHAIRCGRC